MPGQQHLRRESDWSTPSRGERGRTRRGVSGRRGHLRDVRRGHPRRPAESPRAGPPQGESRQHGVARPGRDPGGATSPEGPEEPASGPSATGGAWPSHAPSGLRSLQGAHREDGGRASPSRTRRSRDPYARRGETSPGYSSSVPEDRTLPPAPKFRPPGLPRDLRPWTSDLGPAAQAAGLLGRVRIFVGSAPRMYPCCRAYLSRVFSSSLRPR